MEEAYFADQDCERGENMRTEIFGLPKKIKYFTHEEQIALLEKYKAGDISARNKLLESQYHYIVKLASANSCKRYTKEDVIQDAMIGAINGINRWDPARGSLASALFYSIKFQTIEQISRNETLLSVPARYLNYRSTIVKEDNEDELRHIMRSFKLSKKNNQRLREVLDNYSSLDAFGINSEYALDKYKIMTDDRIDFENETIEKIERDAILRAVGGMSAQKIQIVKLYFGIGCNAHTMEQVAKIMGMTRQNVDQHLKKVRRDLSKNQKLQDMAAHS